MFLKKLTLENIRSYKYQEINFSKGSTLLSGDIGTGKTSVLLAIEFALFGIQPGQRGSSLMRNGETKASVIIEFELDGNEVIIERTLKKAKTISQDYCSIRINEEKKEISVTELKNKILELLNYPKEFAKKQNLLYKFTVYTPQEEMKQIILQDPETRINTLRHVFGIDKYKKILENSVVIASKLREEKRIKQAITANIEKEKIDVVEKEKDLEQKQQDLLCFEKELFLKKERKEQFQNKQERIENKIKEKNKLEQEIEKTKIIISNKNDLVVDNEKTRENLRNQIREFEKLKFDESKISQFEIEIIAKKKEKEKINEMNLDISSQITTYNLKNEDQKRLEQRISKLEICPTCLQDVDANYRANVLNNLHSEIFENNKKIKELEQDKSLVLEKTKAINFDISEKEKEVLNLKIIKTKLQGIEEKQKSLREIGDLNLSLQKDVELLSQHLAILKKSVFELSSFFQIFETNAKELEKASKEEKISEIKVVELKKEIEFFSLQIRDLKEKIKEIEKINEQVNYVSQLEEWISKKFLPLISSIEKNVMTRLKLEFSKLFSEWFAMLVSDSFDVRLSDDFTPIIEYQDYEIDYAYLSGGERTAIALAYRLSLNQVINSIMSKIKTRELVILDEPTDGFSEQQLDKMRDVLQQLDAKQLIIVSHEQKIGSFVENVIKFKKNNGLSVIE